MPKTLVVLVSTRGAMATLAGVPAVERHVQAGRTLGMDVVVVYPPERRALGAEIRGLVENDAACLPADQFADQYEGDPVSGEEERGLMVVAAEWYLSLSAIVAIRDAPYSRIFGRVCERGCVSVPVARVGRAEAAAVARQLGATSAAAALAAFLDARTPAMDLDSRSEQRLSDNVSAAHAEEKLIENLFGPHRVLPLLRLRPTFAPVLARAFSATALGPAGISAVKLAFGLGAAWVLGGGSYAQGLLGAVLYFLARLIGASGIVLARASLSDNDVREKLDLAGDTILHIALLWSLAGGPARGDGAMLLAILATTGVLLSTGVAYVFVLKETWQARRREDARFLDEEGIPLPAGAPRADTSATGDEFVSRFVQRDGIAYALLFAAATGSLDLFLWAAAVASHLFYVLWLLARPRRAGGAMPLGRPA